jgi:hypothetical protein
LSTSKQPGAACPSQFIVSENKILKTTELTHYPVFAILSLYKGNSLILMYFKAKPFIAVGMPLFNGSRLPILTLNLLTYGLFCSSFRKTSGLNLADGYEVFSFKEVGYVNLS